MMIMHPQRGSMYVFSGVRRVRKSFFLNNAKNAHCFYMQRHTCTYYLRGIFFHILVLTLKFKVIRLLGHLRLYSL